MLNDYSKFTLVEMLRSYAEGTEEGTLGGNQRLDAADYIEALEARVEELTKPVEDAEVRDWIDYKYAKANSYKTLGDALDIIERLAREVAELNAKLKEVETKRAELIEAVKHQGWSK